MITVNYAVPDFRIKKEGEKEFIFDAIRKKWILLTPEEWVRQNFVQYLVQEMKYPPSLLAIEKEMQLGELKKRFDILVYDTNHQPWMMIECKAMEVKLEEAVLQQVLRYNISIPVKYLLITNGQYCMGWVKEKGELVLMDALPAHGG